MAKDNVKTKTDSTVKTKLKVVGADHGNVNVKVFDGKKQTLLPNQIVRKDQLENDDTIKSKLELNEYETSRHPNEIYLWGKDIALASNTVSTYTGQDRYIQKFYKILNEIILADYSEDTEPILVVTGVPSRQKGTTNEEAIKKAFEGSHVVKKNGKDVIARVEEVRVLAQPLGTVMDMYLDLEGNIVDPDISDEYLGIIDAGGGTLDLEGIKRLDVMPEDRETINKGIYSVYQKIADHINKDNPNANATAKQVEYQILGDEPDSYRISKRAKVDIAKIKEQYFREYAEDIIAEINVRWTNRDKFDRIILTGGGAKVLAKYLKEWEPDLIVVEDSQMANVRGFYKYGIFVSLA